MLIRKIAEETGASSEQIVEQALDLLEKERLLDAINAGHAALRRDKRAWNREQRERELWHASLSDGEYP